ncbi:MAG: guanylate kinase [Oligoflexia bacterium]|nr:guanylate kinase [Oligoflexia bacterium]MBF0364633.1 guanylate kinase [Oligoflexia bacterium]
MSIIIIVAPSGAGKSTLIKKVREDFPALKESISFTTRAMRPGEVAGKSYFFIAREEFLKRRDQDEFIEWAEVHSNFYGTSKCFIQGELSKGHSVLLDIDVQGADNIKKSFGDVAKAIFIAPPSFEVLEKRLRGRGTDDPEVIARRLKNAKQELQRRNDYDYVVVNDQLEVAYKELKQIIEKIIR